MAERPQLRLWVPEQPSELRAVFRVEMAGALLNVVLDDLAACALLDANSEGIALLTDVRRFDVRRVVQVELRLQEVVYRGQAEIRNRNRRGPHEYRLGLRILQGEDELRRGLRAVAVAAQREHLRRRAEGGG